MMRRTRALGFGALLLVPAAAAAQTPAPADSAGPRSGTRGAEVAIGEFASGRLLRFTSPTAAWLLGADFVVIRESAEQSLPFGGTDDDTRTSVRVAARAGVRGYREPGRALRPFTGAGLTGTILRPGPGFQSWDAGLYGELGAAYFFSPHVSLGAVGELSVGYGEDRRGSVSDLRVTRWRVGSSLVRVLGAVYF